MATAAWNRRVPDPSREANVKALVEAAAALADDYATISPKYHNTPVYEALRAALAPFKEKETKP